MISAFWTEPILIGEAGAAWLFPERSVIFTETRTSAPTAADADALFDFFAFVDGRFEPSQAPLLIHDWRSIHSVPRETRRTFVRRRKEIRRRPERVVIATTMDPIVRMAVQTVALAAQMLAQAVKLELVADVGPTLRSLGVGQPDPEVHAELRLAFGAERSPSPSARPLA